MITLSELEKDFLKRIVDLSERTYDMFLGNLLDKDLLNIDVFLDRQKNIAEFRFDQQCFPANTDFVYKVREMSWTFMKLVKLLKYLEKENYLYLYQESEPENTSRFGQLIMENSFVSYQIYDPDIKKLLIDYSHRTIVVGQSLIDYVKNDFKTQEQLRHEQNVAIAEQNLNIANASLDKAEIGITQSKKSIGRATIAIIISIILGLISIGSSFYLANQQTKSETRINKQQFNSLNQGIISIDSILKNSAIPDTINAKIVNEIKNKTVGNK